MGGLYGSALEEIQETYKRNSLITEHNHNGYKHNLTGGSKFLLESSIIEDNLVKISDIYDTLTNSVSLDRMFKKEDVYIYLRENGYTVERYEEPNVYLSNLARDLDRQTLDFTVKIPAKLKISYDQICDWILAFINAKLLDCKLNIKSNNHTNNSNITTLIPKDLRVSDVLLRLSLKDYNNHTPMTNLYQRVLGNTIRDLASNILASITKLNKLTAGEYLITEELIKEIKNELNNLTILLCTSQKVNNKNIVWMSTSDDKQYGIVRMWVESIRDYLNKCIVFKDTDMSLTPLTKMKTYSTIIKIISRYHYSQPSIKEINNALKEIEQWNEGDLGFGQNYN